MVLFYLHTPPHPTSGRAVRGTENTVQTSAPTTESSVTNPAYARFSADRLRWVYAARADIFDSRTYLQQILIDPAPAGGVYIVATNGALMMIAFDADGTASHRFTFDPLEEIVNICGFPTNEEALFSGRSYADTIVIDGSTLTACRAPLHRPANAIETEDLVKVLSQEVEIGEDFPDWRPFATHGGACNPVTAWIDLMQLEIALTGLAETRTGISLARYVRDGQDATREPMHIAFEDLPLRGVLMPLKNNEGRPPLTRCAMPFDAK